MRILMLHEHQTPPGQGGGGAESILRDHAQAMKLAGHEVAWWYGQGSIQRAVADFRPDMVHVQTIHNAIPDWIGVMRWIQGQGIPHVWVLMDYWPFCGNRMLLRGRDDGETCSALHDVCDACCACGPAPAEWASVVNGSPVVALNRYSQAIYRRNGIRCDHVVEMGVDTALFSPGDTRDRSCYTSSAWASAPCKGLHVLKASLRGLQCAS